MMHFGNGDKANGSSSLNPHWTFVTQILNNSNISPLARSMLKKQYIKNLEKVNEKQLVLSTGKHRDLMSSAYRNTTVDHCSDDINRTDRPQG